MSELRLTRGFSYVEDLMDVTVNRHRVLAHNLANLHVPGFTRSDVVFEEELARQLRSGASLREAIGETRAVEVEDDSRPRRNDGNNVELEFETAEMEKNKILHDLYVTFLNMRVSQMRFAIQGRG